MKSSLAALVFLLAGSVALGALTINTPPNVVECQPTLISWSGGTPPYFLSILPGSSPNANAIQTFNQTSSTSLTWIVNIAANTNIGLTLRDSTGTVAQSAPFTILAGSDTSCTNTTSVVPGPTGGSSGSSATTGGAATGGAATGTSAGPTPSGTTTSSGAAANVAQFGAAAVVGAALGALFV